MGPFGTFIRNFVFLAGVNNNGDKLFTGVNNTGNKLSSVLMSSYCSMDRIRSVSKKIVVKKD
jgi:hypothetical protein